MKTINTHKLKQTLTTALQSRRYITFLTGAGISAESGIPTYRGNTGYWTIGSINYQPQEINTREMFLRSPQEVWRWILYFRGVCRNAAPNQGHQAIAQIEQYLNQRQGGGDRFRLITQNVDELHLRAGNSPQHTYQVHGNINTMRCTRGCSTSVYPIPESLVVPTKTDTLTAAEWQLLICPKCGAKTRPHILFWDEYYNEEFFRAESALQVSRKTALLVVVGTTGAAFLPNQVVAAALSHGGDIIDINIEESKFSDLALASPGGMFLKGNSTEMLAMIGDLMEG